MKKQEQCSNKQNPQYYYKIFHKQFSPIFSDR